MLVLGLFSFADARVIKVKSYYKPSTGSYVQSYYKTSPNRSKLDNWSTKGNYNPYTGKKGYVNPYRW
ncbi:MAG: SH3 superfamily protein [Parcubacteria group bacterium GW2011_GWB1_43_8b]|nr:MAG: SH3 superfamily protein [Parcubacteria group bacterium GW2011_GWB1_43_8b]